MLHKHNLSQTIVLHLFPGIIVAVIYFILASIMINHLLPNDFADVLFSLYHFFSPWYFFSRVFMMIPLYWWVARKKNIRFSIIAHVIGNCTYK